MNKRSTIACLVWDFVAKEHVLLSEYERREKKRSEKSSNPNSDSSVRDNSDDD